MVTLTTAAERPTAVIVAVTTWAEVPTLWLRLLAEVHTAVHWEGRGPRGRSVMLYRDDQPRVEVGVELDQPARVDGRITRSHLPAGPVAMSVHRGGHAGLTAAHEEIRQWCWDQRLRLAGPRWEVHGYPTTQSAEPEIEIFYLIA